MSGTPPRQMLRTDPVTLDPKDSHIRVYRRPPSDRTSDPAGGTYDFDALAYHWGSLTTGHWLTALWILLAPFAFANVAGWMNGRPNRLTHAAVRLAGLGLTALLVTQAGYLFLEVFPLLAPVSWRRTAFCVSAAAYPFLFVWGLVMRLSTQSHFTRFGPGERARLVLSPRTSHLLPRMFWRDPDAAVAAGQFDDPAGARLGDPVTWEQHAILHRLRRIHLAAGCGVVVALYGSVTRTPWMRVAALLMAIVAVALTVLTGRVPRSRAVIRTTALLPLASLAVVAASWAGVAAAGWPPQGTVHGTTFYVALTLGAFGLAAATAGLAPLGAIVVGTLFGGSLGVGLSLLAGSLAEIDAAARSGAGWVTVAMLHLVLFVIGLSAALTLDGDPLPDRGRAMALLGRVTRRARLLLRATALFGLAAGTAAFALGCSGPCTAEALQVPVRGSAVHQLTVAAMGIVALLVTAAAYRVGWRWALAALAAGGTLVVLFALGRLPTLRVGGMSADLGDLVGLSRALVVVFPTILVLRSMLGSIRRGTSNRQVGILWDIASMWPRWFHPLAPPAYGPMVVTDLAHRLVIDPPDLLEGHSQGSVLSVIAVSQMKEEPDGIGLITYGSPIGSLYRQLFPGAGVDELVSAVDRRLGGRWVNLWRDTDPIGGVPVGLPDERDLPVRDGSGHSGYEVTQAFVEARHSLAR